MSEEELRTQNEVLRARVQDLEAQITSMTETYKMHLDDLSSIVNSQANKMATMEQREEFAKSLHKSARRLNRSSRDIRVQVKKMLDKFTDGLSVNQEG